MILLFPDRLHRPKAAKFRPFDSHGGLKGGGGGLLGVKMVFVFLLFVVCCCANFLIILMVFIGSPESLVHVDRDHYGNERPSDNSKKTHREVFTRKVNKTYNRSYRGSRSLGPRKVLV